MVPDPLPVGTKGTRLNLRSLKPFGSRHLAIWSWILNYANFWGTTTYTAIIHLGNLPFKLLSWVCMRGAWGCGRCLGAPLEGARGYRSCTRTGWPMRRVQHVPHKPDVSSREPVHYNQLAVKAGVEGAQVWCG